MKLERKRPGKEPQRIRKDWSGGRLAVTRARRRLVSTAPASLGHTDLFWPSSLTSHSFVGRSY